MSEADIVRVQNDFVAAAKRSLAAGCEWLELHSAHGYLSHEFLSPLTNQRTDKYGGSFENRIRFLLETARAVRAVWPERLPLTVRISCTDWVDGGWDIEQSIELARRLKVGGVDLIDCSSGGTVPDAKIPVGAGYQVPFAERIRGKRALRRRRSAASPSRLMPTRSSAMAGRMWCCWRGNFCGSRIGRSRQRAPWGGKIH